MECGWECLVCKPTKNTQQDCKTVMGSRHLDLQIIMVPELLCATSQGTELRRQRTVTKFQWLTEMGQDGGTNHCQLLKGTKESICKMSTRSPTWEEHRRHGRTQQRTFLVLYVFGRKLMQTCRAVPHLYPNAGQTTWIHVWLLLNTWARKCWWWQFCLKKIRITFYKIFATVVLPMLQHYFLPVKAWRLFQYPSWIIFCFNCDFCVVRVKRPKVIIPLRHSWLSCSSVCFKCRHF